MIYNFFRKNPDKANGWGRRKELEEMHTEKDTTIDRSRFRVEIKNSRFSGKIQENRLELNDRERGKISFREIERISEEINEK